MKEYLLRALARAPRVAQILTCIVYFILLFGAGFLFDGVLYWCVGVFLLVIHWRLGNIPFRAVGMLWKQPMQKMEEECDPYPLLEEMTTELNYHIPKQAKINLHINYAASLMFVGDKQKALDYLSSISIEEYRDPLAKIHYYNNLSTILDDLGDYTSASAYYQKAIQLYDTVKNPRVRAAADSVISGLKIDELHRQGKDVEAMALLDARSAKSLFGTVVNAFTYAQYALAVEDYVTARGKLRFVIENGNRLYIVKEANVLLEHCEREIQKRNEQLGKGESL